MSRNSQGLYTLPLPPVRPAELIESAWANTTMDDIASALTGSLPRDGSAPMVGPLILSNDPITASQQAASKAYVDSFIAFGSGLPVGSVVAFAGINIPAGYFECNGQAISRTTYASLFTAIGVTYGSGDGSTTFNVPDMRDEFIRGKNDTRPIGNKQGATFASHNHGINDPGHTHTLTDPGHVHSASQPAHTHGVNDPGHSHHQAVSYTSGGGFAYGVGNLPNGDTGTSGTGISIQAGGGEAVTVNPASTGITSVSAVTGIGTGAAGGDETRPQNIAQIYIIKAAQDSSGPATLTGITTSDAQMISVDNTLPNAPDLVIHSNVAFGTVKLDGDGKIPLSQMPTGDTQFMGYFDASSGNLPSGTFANGSYFVISVSGTLTVYDPVTFVASPTVVAVGSQIHWVDSITNPTGWYYITISNNDFVSKTDPTGAAIIPPGTTAERPPVSVGGYFRFNTDTQQFEGYNGTNWGTVGGGATGAPNNPFIYENDIHVTADYTITTGKNGMSAGPITVDNGVTVTVPNGSTWSVV